MIKVLCISGVRYNYSSIERGREYLIKVNSLYVDSDGYWTVEVYNLNETYIGRFYLKHFKSVL